MDGLSVSVTGTAFHHLKEGWTLSVMDGLSVCLGDQGVFFYHLKVGWTLTDGL